MKTFVVILSFAVLFAALPVLAQDTAEAETAPEPLWTGNGALGYVSTSGNTDTSSLGLDFTVSRRPTPWGLEIFGLYNTADTDGVTTAERYLLGIRGTRELNDRWTLFAGLSGEKDEFAGFDMRTVVEAGATYKAVDNGTIFLAFDGALTYTDENRVPPAADVSYLGALAAVHFGWQISETARLTEDLNYYPNFDEGSDWRMDSITALEASLTDLFGLRMSYEWRYRNEPIDGNDDTDTTTKMSLVFKF